MSDFSELCPLFNTGVFNEITFPAIKMTDISATGMGNALIGTGISAKGLSLCFTFGRTVIITGAYLRNQTDLAATEVIILNRHTTETASGVEFGTCKARSSITFQENYKTWVPFTIASPKTFASNDILGLSHSSNTQADAGVYDLIIRYREK